MRTCSNFHACIGSEQQQQEKGREHTPLFKDPSKQQLTHRLDLHLLNTGTVRDRPHGHTHI